MPKQRIAIALGALSLAASTCCAFAGDIVLAHPWARATAGGAQVGGAYVAILNDGAQPDHLMGASAQIAGRVEIHEMTTVDGVMRMRQVKSLDIPAHGKVELKPGAYHVMLMELKKPLIAGETVHGFLTFERAGEIPVDFAIEAVGASSDHHH